MQYLSIILLLGLLHLLIIILENVLLGIKYLQQSQILNLLIMDLFSVRQVRHYFVMKKITIIFSLF